MAAISWKNPVNGDWNVAGNWSTNTVPTLADAVTISVAGPYIVTISSADVANLLTFNGSQAALLENAGSLTMGGALTVDSGLVSLNEANTIGSVAVSGGVLAFGAGGALGTGTVSMSGGELLGTANETLGNDLTLSGTSTTAATHGTTLTETGSMSIGPNSTLNFGAPGQDGVVVLAPGGYVITKPFTFNVVAGTLRAGSGLVAGMISFGAQPTTVDAGATLDLGGFGLNLTNLLGAGAVIDSGRFATLTLGAANFSGSISGALSLVFNGNAALSGLEDYSGDATIAGSATVANYGAYIVANTSIDGAPGSSFINNGLFEKTGGGGGVSVVTSNFVNNGDLDVLNGEVVFLGGFTNNGVIHGLVTQSGGVTTISPQTPSDINHDGHSDILWQNANGQAAIWAMNGLTQIPGGSALVDPNPGPSWTEIGTGDFNGDGDADILWQNANGQAAIWEMNGFHQVGGGSGLVGPNPGPSWKAVGTGDFNGDGLSDILWQNTDGQAAIWEMNGLTQIPGGSALVGPNPGPDWKVVGTGDFNGDGHSDILWQNANGQAAIWEMNGLDPDRRRQRPRRPQSRAGLESRRNGRLQRRRPFRHPVAERQRAGRDLGNERPNQIPGGSARSAPIPGRVGLSSEPRTSTPTAIPTSCGRTPTVRRRSGK